MLAYKATNPLRVVFVKSPESVLHYAVLAGPPAGARMVTLKDERRLLSAEFR